MMSIFIRLTRSLQKHFVVANFDAYQDGELTNADKDFYRQHLAACQECQEWEFQQVGLIERLGTECPPRMKLSPAAAERIQQKLYRRMRRVNILDSFRTALETAGTLVIFALIIGVFFWWQSTNTTAVPSFNGQSTVTVTPSPTPAPSPTPTPVPVPTIAGSEWDMLVFGDSRTAWASWPEFYAEYIEADLGVNVQLRDRSANGQTSETLLERIQLYEPLRKQIREAEIITIMTTDRAGFAIFEWHIFDNACSTREYERILEEIVLEVSSLRDDNPTIVRLLENYNYTGLSPSEIEFFEIRKECMEQHNAIIQALGEKYGIEVVPLYTALNGPKGELNPDDEGLLNDGLHFNSAGSALVADLLRDLGYDPILLP